MILVVGATGYLGSEICRRLRANGETVRGLVRPGAKRENEIKAMGVEISHGDLKDPASVERACRGVGTIICTATSIITHRPGESLEKVDRDGLLALVQKAKPAGVEKFVFISVSPNIAASFPFIRHKRLIEKAVKASGMIWTILQPSAFMEIAFSPIAGWKLAKGKVRVAGPGTAPASYISLHDVAEFAVIATWNPALENRSIPLGGPEALSAMDAVRVFEKALEKPLKVSHAPAPVLKVMKVATRPFNPYLSSILGLVTSGLSGDSVDMTETLVEFPMKLTTVREVAEKQKAEAGVNP